MIPISASRPHRFVTVVGFTRFGSRVLRLLLAGLLLVSPALTPEIIVVQDDCSLAMAVRAANRDEPVGGCPAGFGADVIRLTGDVDLVTELPKFESEILIEGNKFSVSRVEDGPEFRLATITNGTLTIEELTLSGGDTYFIGGISIGANGRLHLKKSLVQNNSAGFTGGIDNEGFLYVDRSTIRDNSTGYGAGGITNDGTAFIVNSSVSSNAGNSGGGIHNRGDLTLLQSELQGNVASSDPKGFYGGSGGGLLNDGVALLENSTISGNRATGGIYGDPGQGGGINDRGSLTLVNSTVINNVANDHYGITGVFAIENSIVAANTGRNCRQALTDLGGNFADDSSCGAGFATITVGVDIDSDLDYNGGRTRTHALTPNSVAIDVTADCTVAADQRGNLRADGACDSGAYEYDSFGSILTVTGNCPGLTTLAVSDATPEAVLAVLGANALGATPVLTNECVSTPTELEEPRLLRLIGADAGGGAVLEIDVGPASCGGFVQLVDRFDCTTSNAVQLPD